MSRFRKQNQVVWHCQYHFVWVPKYRFKVLHGQVGQVAHNCIANLLLSIGM